MIACHTNIDYFRIGDLTYPALHTILKNLPEQISLKHRAFMGLGGSAESENDKEEPYTVDDAYSVLAMFNGF